MGPGLRCTPGQPGRFSPPCTGTAGAMTQPVPSPARSLEDARRPKARHPALARWLRLAAALVPLVWLVRRVPLSEVGARIREVGVGPLALAFAALLGSLLCGTLRWRT